MNVAWDYRRGTAAGEPGVWIDPAFPQAAVFADLGWLESVLAPVFVGTRASTEIMNVSYVPFRELRVVYRFTSTTDAPVVVRVDFMAPSIVRSVFARARERAMDPSRVALFEEWGVVAWRIPEDDRLPALEVLLAPPSAAAALTRALGTPICAGDLSTSLPELRSTSARRSALRRWRLRRRHREGRPDARRNRLPSPSGRDLCEDRSWLSDPPAPWKRCGPGDAGRGGRQRILHRGFAKQR